MKKFKILASFSTYSVVFIEAENQQQAEEIAHDLNGSEFEPAAQDCWQIKEIHEVQE